MIAVDPEMVATEEGFECALCGDPLNEITIEAGDPFCSVACCNTFHEFEPLSRNYTLSGHAAGTGRLGHPSVSKWDDGARHKRKRKE